MAVAEEARGSMQEGYLIVFSFWGGLGRLRGGFRWVWHLLKVRNVNCGKVEKGRGGGIAVGSSGWGTTHEGGGRM